MIGGVRRRRRNTTFVLPAAQNKLYVGKPSSRFRRLLARCARACGLDANRAHVFVVFSFLAFVLVTVAYTAAIRLDDVELSFDDLSAFERHVQYHGNHTLYVVEHSQPEFILSRRTHEDWRKISWKVDYVLFLYDDIYAVSGNNPEDFVTTVTAALEEVQPHGYGMAMFPCGCIVHNILFQHVDTRLRGRECLMLPGFVLEPEALRWVDGYGSQPEACTSRAEVINAKWYQEESRILPFARDEFATLKIHLDRAEHPDRPEPDRNQVKQDILTVH